LTCANGISLASERKRSECVQGYLTIFADSDKGSCIVCVSNLANGCWEIIDCVSKCLRCFVLRAGDVLNSGKPKRGGATVLEDCKVFDCSRDEPRRCIDYKLREVVSREDEVGELVAVEIG